MAGFARRLAPQGAALALVLLLAAPAALAQTWLCREMPGAAHVGCGLPYNLVRIPLRLRFRRRGLPRSRRAGGGAIE